MKNPSTLIGRAAGACALALALLSPAQAAPVVDMTSALSANGFDLTVNARDVADLYGWQFTLNFDPTLLKATGITEGSFLMNAGSTFFGAGEIDNQAGTISFNYGSLIGPGGGVTGSGDLARFAFDVQGAGPASFTLSDVALLDANLTAIDADARSLVAVVPEPSTYLLFALGLFAVLGARQLQSKTRQ